jgi:electron transport complex protein RnfG
MTTLDIRTMMVGHARKLGLFVFAATALVFSMFFLTRQQINSNERQVMIDQLNSVLAAVHYNNDLLGQVMQLNAADATGVAAPLPYYLARQDKSIVAFVFTVVAPDGYSGPIKMLIGIRPTGEILAVRVIDHQETPGLGDGIEIKKSRWITQFDRQSLQKTSLANWKVKKDGGAFDQMTGATITPRAVVKAIKTLLVYYQAHKQQLLMQAQDPRHVAVQKDPQ